jgi:hypothetical protein
MRHDSDVRHNDKPFDGTEKRGTQVDEENIDRDLPEGHDGTTTHVPVDEPRAGAGAGEAAVDEAAVDEPARPGSVDDRATSPVDRSPTARDTGDPVAPALGETIPADAGQTTSTESLSTDAALAELVPTDASAPEASTDASAPEAGATTPETPTDLKPGEAKPVVIKELWHEGAVDGYRERWHQVQVGFLDDPQEAATQAEALLDDVLEGLRTALADRKSELDSWSSTTGQHDTEEMRVTVRGYRDLLDRLLTF